MFFIRLHGALDPKTQRSVGLIRVPRQPCFLGTFSGTFWEPSWNVLGNILGNVLRTTARQGFDDGVDTVWETLGMRKTIKALYDEEGKSRKLYIAGHSLGGALATIAAARLVFEDDLNVAGMYTMGSPR